MTMTTQTAQNIQTIQAPPATEAIPTLPATKVICTYEDYKLTPDDERYELIDGELFIMAAAPRISHQRVSAKIENALFRYGIENDAGEMLHAPVDVVLSNIDVVQPDIVFLCKATQCLLTEANLPAAPDLVVEILSPSTADRDKTTKRDLYERHGVREYWIVDIDAQTVLVLSLADDGVYRTAGEYGAGQVVVSPLLDGFSLAVDDIF